MNNEEEDGFTVLEVLVALLIVIICLAGYYQSFSVAARVRIEAEEERRSAENVDNLLAELGRTRPLHQGIIEGIFEDGQKWTLRIEPMPEPNTELALSAVAGYLVTLDIIPIRSNRKNIQIRTLKIGLRDS